MPSRDVNAATLLAEANWRRDNTCYKCIKTQFTHMIRLYRRSTVSKDLK